MQANVSACGLATVDGAPAPLLGVFQTMSMLGAGLSLARSCVNALHPVAGPSTLAVSESVLVSPKPCPTSAHPEPQEPVDAVAPSVALPLSCPSPDVDLDLPRLEDVFDDVKAPHLEDVKTQPPALSPCFEEKTTSDDEFEAYTRPSLSRGDVAATTRRPLKAPKLSAMPEETYDPEVEIADAEGRCQFSLSRQAISGALARSGKLEGEISNAEFALGLLQIEYVNLVQMKPVMLWAMRLRDLKRTGKRYAPKLPCKVEAKKMKRE